MKSVLIIYIVFSRGTPLSTEKWEGLQDTEGRVTEVEGVKQLIFRGGVAHSIRQSVWKYLLDYYPWHMTHAELRALTKKRTEEYFSMKLQWRSMTEGQEARFSEYRDRKSLVEKDVNRTDRTHPFFAGDNNPNLVVLQDILMTYVMYNFDLGYVQGMSDILAPLLLLLGNEVDSFWCFVGFMDKICTNFDMDQAGMKHQLLQLQQLLTFASPALAAHLAAKDSGNMYFCFRWLLVWFKREFSHRDIMRLWEVLWTSLPCANFHLLICVAILDAEKDVLISKDYGFTEILKHVNDLSMCLDVDKILSTAEGIYHQVVSAPHLTDQIRIILGLPTLNISTSTHSSEEPTTSKVEANGTVNGGAYTQDMDEVMTNRIDPCGCYAEEVVAKQMKSVLIIYIVFSRGTPLSTEKWEGLQDTEGRVTEVEGVKQLIFRGGVAHSIRQSVWKYLLDYYPWHMTHAELRALTKKRTEEYFSMKLQWRSMTEGQEARFSEYRDRKSLVEKDVNRTDRTHPFFAGDNNPNLVVLQDILMTYVMYNFDLGYVQGMSDILAPLLLLLGNEVDSFWCFVGFMDKICTNFDMDQAGMKHQLLQLQQLLTFASPALAAHLAAKDSGNMYFCFRWLLVWFKREFSHRDIMRLWEVLWTSLPCANFHLLICVAILDAEKDVLISKDYGFTEILKHVNDLSMCLDVDKILSTAEGIYHQVVSAPHLTDQIRIILGLPTLNISTSTHSSEEPTTSKVEANGTVNGGAYTQDMDEVMYQIGLDMNF
uniref:TBC1 domain family member 15 n=1 Tax=Heliothis virescens TaxID=7102 RepID=A0A2A4IWY5_HELVI